MKVFITLVVMLAPFTSLVQAAQTVGLFTNSSSAWPGYTLFPPASSKNTYLINNAGQLIHTWTNASYLPGQSAYFMENGRLLRSAQIANSTFNAGGGCLGGGIQEIDWDGTVLWSYTYSTTNHSPHHDIEWLPNSNILFIAWETKTQSEATNAGCAPANVTASGLWPDSIIEVQPSGATNGTIVWQWHLWDHLVQDYDSTKANYGNVTNNPQLVDINYGKRETYGDWTHCNAVRYNSTYDQILISAHNFNEVWVIDHSTTTAQAAGHTGGNSGMGGDLLYRWGNPAAYRRGTASTQKLYGQHDAQWIPTNCPGGGHILVFNNGAGGRGYSTIDEFVTPIYTNASVTNYTLATNITATYDPTNLYWTYNPSPSFYGENISGTQRLPNSNTLICIGPSGIFFEVDTNGSTVWKYVNPVGSSGPVAQGSVPDSTVFKIRRYATNYSGLSGRDLTPQGTIELVPVVDATNANATVAYTVTNYTIKGTNNSYVVGTMTWTNALTGSNGTLAAASSWQITNLWLNVGTNVITVSGTNSSSFAVSDSVTIIRQTAAPVASFTAASTNGGAPLVVTFTDNSTGTITNRYWSFGDGATTSVTITSLTHTYSFPGTNTVSLIVSGSSGSSTNIQTNLVMATSVDTVGDGIPNWWRAQYFGDTGAATNSQSCAACDPDGDGMNNLQEYIADTNPTNALSRFYILSVSNSTGLAVSYPSSANRKYTLYYRTDLTAGGWTNIPSQTGIPGSGGVDTLTDPSPTDGQRSYRVGVSMP